MNTLIMMYLYFDINGDIKSISPVPSTDPNEPFDVATFPLPEVEQFLTAKKNPFDYLVKTTKRPGSIEHKIVRKKILEINYVRTLDNFLTEIETMDKSRNAIISIENLIDEKQIKISMGPMLKILQLDGTDSEQEAMTSFVNTPYVYLFFTKKHDPYFLKHTITFSPKILYEKGSISIKYTIDLNDVSVFTRKLIDGYNYSVRRKV